MSTPRHSAACRTASCAASGMSKSSGSGCQPSACASRSTKAHAGVSLRNRSQAPPVASVDS
ncbi:MAG: hypothetical protein JM57_09470 [Comamonadaceae bacterium BICA1-1]|nr:MAG: hypothetical protein JM57_09470 [Comamonadaceae bacterium BICA1-1]